ncbi:MAG: sodium-dependent transporter [Lachnospiraceae bacterium]|nr:sodium-dependent transporter [Lachnospiraceae bacterium]
MEEKRDSFKSRLGFLLVSAGCAIGIGNVWRFPYIAGQGGGLFVLIYLGFLVLLGVPVLTCELAVGRASRKSALMGYKALEGPKSFWHLHGWVCMIGNYLLMMYYTTVTGWMVSYFIKFVRGEFSFKHEGEEVADTISGIFGDLLADPKEMMICMSIVVLAGIIVISFGLQNGLERVSKVMMISLFVLMLILAMNSFTLSGVREGLTFYLVPNKDRIAEVGFGNIVKNAMNQAFFTLSLGIGAMEIFGSYMAEDQSLPGEAIRICALDTAVALMSGLIIFPACFTYHVDQAQGPALIFNTLPTVFYHMAGGRIWGSLFFLFMIFASFSTVIAVFQNIIAQFADNFKVKKKLAIILNLFIIWLGSIPCVLGYNVWSNLHLIGNRDVLDSEDFVVSNLLLPIGSLIFVLFCVLPIGWKYKNFIAEANSGEGAKYSKGKATQIYLTVVVPLLILVIIALGLIPQ